MKTASKMNCKTLVKEYLTANSPLRSKVSLTASKSEAEHVQKSINLGYGVFEYTPDNRITLLKP